MNKFIITEFDEGLIKDAQVVEFSESVMDQAFGEEVSQVPEDELVIDFRESTMDNSSDDMEGPEFSEITPEIEEAVPGTEAAEEVVPEIEIPIEAPKLPGSDLSLADDQEEEDEEVIGSWKEDGDVRDFGSYLAIAYKNIPKHDGTKILGCERALNYLNSLNKEISRAIALDSSHILDIALLDDFRFKMINDMMTLKNHMKNLQRKIREEHGKKANFAVAGSDIEFAKEASSARPQMVITPFERAISGMLINAVVSAGRPFEDVYEYLKKKYKFTDREELAIMQLVTDMGHPVFKDRGSYGEDADGEDAMGIDFMTNYFA